MGVDLSVSGWQFILVSQRPCLLRRTLTSMQYWCAYAAQKMRGVDSLSSIVSLLRHSFTNEWVVLSGLIQLTMRNESRIR